MTTETDKTIPFTEKVLNDLAAERQRQIEVEGYTLEVDDRGSPGRLAAAGASYAIHAAYERSEGNTEALQGTPEWWPFDKAYWKPKQVRENLIRSAALIIAEVEKLDRELSVPI